MPDKQGKSKLSESKHYMAWGDIPEWIETPPSIPELFECVWDWFLSLNDSRQGDNAISFSDMQAFFNMTNERPSRWDLSVIQSLDAQFLQMRYENSKANQ